MAGWCFLANDAAFFERPQVGFRPASAFAVSVRCQCDTSAPRGPLPPCVQIARSIQFQSSQSVADDAANSSDSESVSFGTLDALRLRRLLQVKGINDTDYFTALANLSSTLL